jgi:hypothetical protein
MRWTVVVRLNRIDLIDETGEVIGMFSLEWKSVAQRMADVQNGVRAVA